MFILTFFKFDIKFIFVYINFYQKIILWDQCKECGINLQDPKDIEVITINSNEIQKIIDK